MDASPDELQNPSAYELHLFGWFDASQKVVKIRRNVYPLIDAVSLCGTKSKIIYAAPWVKSYHVSCLKSYMAPHE